MRPPHPSRPSAGPAATLALPIGALALISGAGPALALEEAASPPPALEEAAAAPAIEAGSNPVARLAALLEGESGRGRRSDVAARLVDFVWERDGASDGKSFVDPGLKREDGALRGRAGAAARSWADLNPMDAARVYYFIGAGPEPPAWLTQADESLAAGARFRPGMLAGLDGWTAPRGPAAAGADAGRVQAGRMGGGNPSEWLAAFLADASRTADKTWRAAITPPGRIRREIEPVSEPPAVPSGAARRLPARPDPSAPLESARSRGSADDPPNDGTRAKRPPPSPAPAGAPKKPSPPPKKNKTWVEEFWDLFDEP